MMDASSCERCGRAVPAVQRERNFAGICPHCLGAMLAREEKADAEQGRPGTLSRFDVEHAPLKPGDVFRSFEILEIVARGGMSYVFRARQKGLQRIVALKVLDPELASSDTFRARFHREAKILAALNHPNIVQVYEFGQERDLLYLAMEHVEGMDLETLLAREGRPERLRFLSIIRDVARGLRGIHDAGLVHRDIKPANLLITPSGQAKIADFGIAIDSRDDERLTETGTFIGTPHYVSPEHVQGKKVDGRSDLYSLGVILYQGLTGRTPFAAPNPTALLLKHVQETPPAIWKAAEDVPPALGEMVRRLLAKNPSARPDSALALERELDRVIGSSGPWKSIDENPGEAPAVPVRRPVPAASAGEERPRIRKGLAAGLALVALLLVGLLALVFRSPEPEPPAPLPPRSAGPAAASRTSDSRVGAPEPLPFPKSPDPSVADRAAGIPVPVDPAQPAWKNAAIDPELLKLGAEDRRRRLDQLTALVNFSGVAVAYAELRQMPETASHLRRLMDRNEEKIRALLHLLRRDGQEATLGVLLRSTDRVLSVQGLPNEKSGPDATRERLKDILVHAGGGPPVRLEVDRDGATEAFPVEFGERTKELAGIVQLVGLRFEEETSPKPPGAAASEPAPAPAIPAPSVPAPPAVVPPSLPALAAVPAAARERLPAPDGAALKEAERLIHEVFKEDYAKKAAVDRGYFAKKLLKHGQEAKENGPDTMILLREAEDLAAQVGDADTALKAVHEESRRYLVDELEGRFRVLGAAARAARTVEENVKVARAFALLADQAIAEDNADLCERVAAAGVQAARKGKEIPLVAHFDARLREAGELKSRTESIRRAREALASNPKDEAAHQVLGYHLGLVRGKWPEALPHLARGEPGKLREAASMDLERPGEAKAAQALGDLWWELAEKESGKPQEALRRRACYWYDRAAPGLGGMAQLKARQRLAGFGMQGNFSALLGWWRFDEGTGTSVTDRSLGGHDGRIEGGSWGAEPNEGSLVFDVEQTRVLLELGEIPAPWTLTLWVNREASRRPAAKLVDSRSPRGTSLRLEQTPSTGRVGISQYTVIDQAFDYQVPEGEWTHLGFVATDKAVLLYVGGGLVGSWEHSVPLHLDALGGFGGLSFRGALSEVRLWGRALGVSELAELHDLGRR